MIAVYLAMLETDVDRDKFMKLYESYEKKLFAVALRILENNEKAEDAVQQAWLRIIQHWERVSCLEWDLAGGYAVTIVKNAAIDILRQEKRVEPLPATWDPPAREESQDEYQYLVSLIQTLPDTYRRILELKYVEEYGAKAKYWKGNPDGGFDINWGDEQSHVYTQEQKNLLVWTDSKANITFRIIGMMDKDEMIKMAESVVVK